MQPHVLYGNPVFPVCESTEKWFCVICWIMDDGSCLYIGKRFRTRGYRNPIKIKPGRKEEEERHKTNLIVLITSVSRNVKLQAKVNCLKETTFRRDNIRSKQIRNYWSPGNSGKFCEQVCQDLNSYFLLFQESDLRQNVPKIFAH